MSNRERRRRFRGERHLCAQCRARAAKYRYHGHVRADRQHVLCFQCFRSARERMRAFELKGTVPLFSSAREKGDCPPFNRPAPLPYQLTSKQTEHRRRMLAHLEALALGQ